MNTDYCANLPKHVVEALGFYEDGILVLYEAALMEPMLGACWWEVDQAIQREAMDEFIRIHNCKPYVTDDKYDYYGAVVEARAAGRSMALINYIG